MFSDRLKTKTTQVLELARKRSLKITTAESCTGGLIMALLTEIPGSSDVVDRGFITYSNEAKIEMLGVTPQLIKDHGAVSEEVARAMAAGAINHSEADISISVTGIAGPEGGTPDKPVGLVHFGCSCSGKKVLHMKQILNGTRQQIRLAAVERAIAMLHSQLRG